MAKINELMEGRNQGLKTALDIVRKDGIEGLEKEIKFRNLTGVSLNVTRKELEEATNKFKVHATEVAIVISMVALLEEFQFSKFQVHKFKKTFDRKVDDILSGLVDPKDYIAKVKEQYDIEIEFTD